MLASLACLGLAACQSTQNYVKPDFNPAVHAKDHEFCVQVARQPKQNPTVPAAPCIGCPLFGKVALDIFGVVVNGATGTEINEVAYGDCMNQNDYAAVPMTEEDWAHFNDLQSVPERRKFLLELLRQAHQKGP
ncbi:MAG TPA: hypothetical protein DCE33_04690 [Rhodospirillaceae bacterium]|nr:hypothetical protein [Rhodospirillaceae bacterium]